MIHTSSETIYRYPSGPSLESATVLPPGGQSDPQKRSSKHLALVARTRSHEWSDEPLAFPSGHTAELQPVTRPELPAESQDSRQPPIPNWAGKLQT